MEEKIYKCKYCGKEFASKYSLAAHCSHCKNTSAKSKKYIHIFYCKHCGKEFSFVCSDTVANSPKRKQFCSDECRKTYMSNKMKGNPSCRSKSIGRPGGYTLSDETKQKISKARRKAHESGNYHYKVWIDEDRIAASKKSKIANKNYWTEEKRKEHSERMKLVVANNPESYSSKNVSGRVRYINYNGVNLHGTWELIVAQWLDFHNLNWTNKITGISYIFNNSEHLYFPDFYVKDLDLYIEVKGYETERDKIKWNTCKNKGIKLLVLKKNEIYQIKNNNFISIENFDIIK